MATIAKRNPVMKNWQHQSCWVSLGHSLATALTTGQLSQQTYKPGMSSLFYRHKNRGSVNLITHPAPNHAATKRQSWDWNPGQSRSKSLPFSTTHIGSHSSLISSISPIMRTRGQGLVWKIQGSSGRRTTACPLFHGGMRERHKESTWCAPRYPWLFLNAKQM